MYSLSRIKNLILILLVFTFSLESFANSKTNCDLRYVTEPPFWVVEGNVDQQNKEYENLKGADGTQTFSEKRTNNEFSIPKRSIVIKDPRRSVITTDDRKHEYVPVIVASTPTDFNEVKQDILPHMRAVDKKMRSVTQRIDSVNRRTPKVPEVGQEGYIYNGSLSQSSNGSEVRYDSSLIPPGTALENSRRKSSNGTEQALVKNDYVFVVKKESPFFKIPGIENLDQDHRLELATSNGKYLVRYCTDPSDPNKSRTSYFFNIYRTDENGISRKESFCEFDPMCTKDYLASLLPVQDDKYLDLLSIVRAKETVPTEFSKDAGGIENILFLEGLKLSSMNITEVKAIAGNCFSKGPYDSYHYTGFYGERDRDCQRDIVQNENIADSFLQPHAQCAFLGALKKFNEACPDCALQWGNGFWPKGRHQSHDSGLCIDIRPIKKGSNALGATETGTRSYDAEKTKIVMETMMKAGATKIVFDDRARFNQIKGFDHNTEYFNDAKYHDDHLHVCFPENKLSAYKAEQKQIIYQLKELNIQKAQIDSNGTSARKRSIDKKIRILKGKFEQNVNNIENEKRLMNPVRKSCNENLKS